MGHHRVLYIIKELNAISNFTLKSLAVTGGAVSKHVSASAQM